MTTRSGAAHLAGWVFADLTLVVLLIVLVMTPPRPVAQGAHPAPSKPPTAAPSAEATPQPSKAEPSQPPVLQLDEVPKIRISVPNADLVAGGTRASAAANKLTSELKASLAAQGLTKRQAGLLLTFGAAPTANFQGGVARRSAERANQVILRLQGFRTAKTRAYWTYAPAPAFVEIEIFFFDE
ncbi:hypothetical protein ACWEOZ_12285 [Actinoplanes sp. NPDC004185]